MNLEEVMEILDERADGSLLFSCIENNKIDGTIFRTWGTSEGFVQDNEDSIAQVLIDNTSTGSSLKANRLKFVDTLMESSTRMYASKTAMADPEKRQKIMELKMCNIKGVVAQAIT